MSGTLYLVSTPIGHLEDITMRALRVLREVPLIAAEDTRRTARLLHHYQIDTRTTSFHAHNEHAKAPRLLAHLEGGASLALVTDAGTPVVSDPGQLLVREAMARGIRVEAIPGASAILAALVSSGMGAEGFTFLGFPPAKSEARKRWFEAAAVEARPLVVFEAPHRLLASLRDAAGALGDREVVVCRELTKIHEERISGTISAAITHFEQEEARGELTLVFAPPAPDTRPAPELTDDEAYLELGRLTESGLSRREAIATLARRTGRPARDVYAQAERGKARGKDGSSGSVPCTVTMSSLHIVILAAGRGTRMKSELPKVLHHVGGEPMIAHVLDTAAALAPASTTVIIGHMAERLRGALKAWPTVQAVLQEPQLGTGHALLQAAPVLTGATGTVVLLSGDVPLLQAETLRGLLARHRETGAVLTVLTSSVEQPKGYGRIVREAGQISRIVEERDATEAERALTEINSGIFAFELDGLFDALRLIATENVQGEYYLPDLVGIYRRQGRRVDAFPIAAREQLLGINSREELALMNAILRDARNKAVMAAGVTLVDPATAWIGPHVEIGRDTVIHPNVYLEGHTRLGTGCEIHAGTRIVDSTLADNVLVQNCCVIRQSTIESGASLGPFAHLRPESHLDEGAHVGNFVELKKARLGAGTKAGHLAYLGDATIGAGVNIGAGVITCNYDGARKHQTIIEDEVFVGTDSQLVAPVRIGKGAYVAAGSSITEDVPAGALGIARGRQVNKDGWADERRRHRQTAASTTSAADATDPTRK